MKTSNEMALGAPLWGFSDYPYALDFVVLPPAGYSASAFSERPLAAPKCDLNEIVAQIESVVSLDSTGSIISHTPSQEELFWFRWITGHQTSFLIWQLMGGVLEHKSYAFNSKEIDSLRSYVNGYNAMLLYTSSCPPDIYHSFIRPRMYHQHHGFSGTWAPDFSPVRKFFRGNTLAQQLMPESDAIEQIIRENRVIHDDVANRLVPGGGSLLQKVSSGTPVGLSKKTALLYDSFFLTLRSSCIDDEDMKGQLLRRLQVITCDVMQNGLYPYETQKSRENASSQNPIVTAYANRFRQNLAETARFIREC